MAAGESSSCEYRGEGWIGMNERSPRFVASVRVRQGGSSRENVWSIGCGPSDLKKRSMGEGERRGGSENVAELWKMTIEFRDWSVHRSPHGEGEEEGTDAVFMRMGGKGGRKDRAHVDRGIR